MCKELGVEDYEQWLEDCPERVFAAWQAAYSVHPFGDEQFLLARVCALLYMQVQSKYGAKTWEAMDRLTACFMPPSWTGRKADSLELDIESIKQAQEALKNWQPL